MDVDANTGEVLGQDDDEDIPDEAEDAAPTVVMQNAIVIALGDAGAGEVVEVDLDVEDGRVVWEVDVEHGRTQIEYQIDVENGQIVDTDRDT